jgi:hypothetical protein
MDFRKTPDLQTWQSLSVDLDRQAEKFEEQQKRAVAANQGLFGAHDQIKMEAQQFVSETIAACIGEEGISYQEARKVVRELCQRSKGTSSKQERRSTSLPDKSPASPDSQRMSPVPNLLRLSRRGRSSRCSLPIHMRDERSHLRILDRLCSSDIQLVRCGERKVKSALVPIPLWERTTLNVDGISLCRTSTV